MLLNYIKLLLLCNFKKTCTNMAETAGQKISHDSLNRVLHADWEGKKHLEKVTNPKKLKGGYLEIDDTVVEKLHSKELEGSGYVYSSAKGKSVFGYQVVLLVWTDGQKRVVLDQKIYRKGGKTKIEIALDMISYARNRLRLKPDYVLFDSWYAAQKLLKRISDYGWYFCTRIKKNRLFNGKKLSLYKGNPYWNEVGELKSGFRVRVIRNGKKYFATNRLSLSRSKLLKTYKVRQHIEEVNKQLKFLGFMDCQARSIKAHSQYLWCCIIAFSCAEKESREKGLSLYKWMVRNISNEESIDKALMATGLARA